MGATGNGSNSEIGSGLENLDRFLGSSPGVPRVIAMNDFSQFIAPASDLDVVALAVCLLLLAAVSLTEVKVPW